MWCDGVIRTVEDMVNPMIHLDLMRAREADLERKLRHAHHTAELPPTVLASLGARVLTAVFKRGARQRPVEQRTQSG